MLISGTVCLLLLSFASLPLLSCRGGSREYSGELALPFFMPHPTFQGMNRYKDLVVKVFASGHKVRMEAPDFIFVFDTAKGEGWVLLHRDLDHPVVRNGAVEYPPIRRFVSIKATDLPRQQTILWEVMAVDFCPNALEELHRQCPDLQSSEGFAKGCQKVGDEVIGGRSAEKWELPDRTLQVPHYLWTDKILKVPLKRSYGYELRNVVQGRQDPSLFMLPAGYEELK